MLFEKKKFLIYLYYGFNISLRILIKFIFQNKDFRDIAIKGINIGHSINERVISRSTNGYATLYQSLRVGFIVGIKFFLLERFLNENKVKLILGGDECYPEFSILLQFAHKRNIKAFVIKGGYELVFYKFNPYIQSAFPDKKIQKKVLNLITQNEWDISQGLLKKECSTIGQIFIIWIRIKII